MRLYSESTLAQLSGLTRDALRAIRQERLKKNSGWQMHGREIAWTEEGIRVAYELELLPLADYSSAEIPAEKNGAGAGSEELTVKIVYPNPRLLLCTSADGRAVRVQVAANKNFRRGMKLRGTPIGDSETLYKLDGRCPRFPGRF